MDLSELADKTETVTVGGATVSLRGATNKEVEAIRGRFPDFDKHVDEGIGKYPEETAALVAACMGKAGDTATETMFFERLPAGTLKQLIGYALVLTFPFVDGPALWLPNSLKIGTKNKESDQAE